MGVSWKKEDFLNQLKPLLKDLYSEKEVSELESLIISVTDATLLIFNLAQGYNGIRRIRNAYLPAITDLYQIDSNGKVRDISHILSEFDGDDAVSKIEKILGINNFSSN